MNSNLDNSNIICDIKGKPVQITMVNWQVTAATVYCDAVDDEVTLLVYRDGVAKCVGYQKYGQPSKEVAKLMQKKMKQLKRQLRCECSDCRRAIQYRDKLLAEEAKAK